MPLIHVSVSIKIARTSAAIMHNNVETIQAWQNPWIKVRESDIIETIYFTFSLDSDVNNLNHATEFVPVSKRKKDENEIPVRPIKSIGKV